ncbi:Rossmann-fold NAD(P)-binding domain-containing protein [Nakamurella lactea]|uniref:hypothetical protein n=1 Tax=Nakamurella lactea TaxID=459515 RepID=UPI00041844B7|nr:hypothetical protein [Nakamurella lactea]
MTTTPNTSTESAPASPGRPLPARPMLIAGGAGHTGSRVAARLIAAGQPVRIASRSTTERLDWTDPSTWPAALDGTSAAFIAYSPDLAFPGVPEILFGFAERARQAGLRQLVLLSGRGEPGARDSVEAVRAAGVPTTALYSAWFAQNLSESFLVEQVLAGEIALPAPDVAEPFVDLDDLAEVAALSLTSDGHADRDYQLTGPAALTFAEAGRMIGDAIGSRIRYRPVSRAQFAAAGTAAGLPAADANGLAELFAAVLDGRNSLPSTDLEQLLGRPATAFGVFVERAAAGGAWTVGSGADA